MDNPKKFEEVLEKEREQIEYLRRCLNRSHADEKDLSGISFSGGGIRSATFCLGILHGLAKLGLLTKFDYLSTVSGGGYIGSWLTAWVRQKREGIKDVEKQLQDHAIPQEDEAKANIDHLRSFSNYLTPKKGFLSVDTWTALAIYGRNLLLNALILIPAFTLVLLLARLIVALYNFDPGVAPCCVPWIILFGVYFAAAVSIVSLFYVIGNLEKKDRGSPSNLNASRMGTLRLNLQILMPLLFVAAAMCWLFQMIQCENATLLKWQSYVDEISNLVDEISNRRIPFFNTPNIKVLFFSVVVVGILYIISALSMLLQKIQNQCSWLIASFVSGLIGGLLVYGAFSCIFRFFDLHQLVTFGPPIILAVFTLTIVILFGLTGRYAREETREWGAMLCGWIGIYNLVWIGIFSVSIYGAHWLYEIESWYMKSALGIGWILTAIVGVLFSGNKTNDGKWRQKTQQLVVSIAPLVFIVGLLAFVSLFTHMSVDESCILRISTEYRKELKENIIPDDLLEKLQKENKVVIIANPTNENGKLLIQDTLKRNYFILEKTVYFDIRKGSKNYGELDKILNSIKEGKNNIEEGKKDSYQKLLNTIFSEKVVMKCDSSEKNNLTIVRDENSFHIFDGAQVYQIVRFSECTMIYGQALSIYKSYLDSLYNINIKWLWVAIISLFVLLIMAWRVDINRFSMHAMYANRLIRCYLGGARSSKRKPNSLTGFDPQDDFHLRQLTISPESGYLGPYHLINTAMNLVSGKQLAWQDRKAEAFVLTPAYCGSKTTGYRPLPDFGSNIKMGNAIAISGAAVSPNMGSFSSPALAFLMTIFNVRLAWWIGNPRKESWKNSGPQWGLFYLLTELFSQTNDDSRYINLSDGGHFENLGVYELIRRRCSRIVVCDVGADPHFEFQDLGNLLHKCRVDFGIEIDIDLTKIQEKKEYCTIGLIHYPENKEGKLLYIKPLLKEENGKEPVDIKNYKKQHENFPHESTVDQFYSELQFESYRMLGFHIIQECNESLRKLGFAKIEENKEGEY